MENIFLLITGAVLIVIGIVNMLGNISTIHSYNRKRVSEEDVPKYGRAVGLGTSVIGAGLIVGFVLELLTLSDLSSYILIAAIVLGLVFILYGQFKYNKGIF